MELTFFASPVFAFLLYYHLGTGGFGFVNLSTAELRILRVIM
jgi:hypothetical protein